MNIFISHAMADREMASRLADSLKAKGFKVTQPIGDIAPGENWALKLGKSLEQANAMVVLLSPEATHSKWVQSEIGYALTSPRFQNRLIPVMVKPTTEIPWILQDLKIENMPANPNFLTQKIAARIRHDTSKGAARSRFTPLASYARA